MHTSWKRLRPILERASELEGEARRAYLDEACGADHELRAQVDELLALEAKAPAFEPPRAAMRELAEATQTPERIGVYRIERDIGSGGMGTVYAAVREGPKLEQRVALKLVKAGMDTRELLRRFERERAVLATLQHDGIARFHDAGATDAGRPFLVMELVDGRPIDQWCDARRLGVRARIELVLRVCAALQHAHERLVVHRDLKPSNVLVRDDGAVKLLDFGLAKLVSDDRDASLHDLTVTGHRMMTPAYASPEQLRGELVGVATDVYSLGVVLHELLVGERPKTDPTRGAAPTERPSTRVVDARAAELRATSPAKLRSTLRGDLDTILLRALHPDVARRYASVAAFALDLRRYLDGMPVEARPDAWSYRARKFAGRHRVLLSAAAIAASALVASAVWSFRESRIARRALEDSIAAHTLADQRLERALKIATTFTTDVTDRLRRLEGTTALQREVLERSIGQLDELARESGSDARARVELAWAYANLGEVMGSDPARNLGAPEEALALFEKSRALTDALLAEDEHDAQARLASFLARFRSGMVLYSQQEPAAALAHFEAAGIAARRGRELAPAHRVADFERSEWMSACKAGLCRADLGDLAGSRADFDRAESLIREISRRRDAPTNAREDLANLLSERCELELRALDAAGAQRSASAALEIEDELVASAPADLQRANNRALTLSRLARAHAMAGDARAAEDPMERNVEHYELLHAEAPSNDYVRLDLADNCLQLGGFCLERRDGPRARAWLERGIVLRGPPTDESHWIQGAESQALLAYARVLSGEREVDTREVEALARATEVLAAPYECEMQVQAIRGNAHLACARLMAGIGRIDESLAHEALARESYDTVEELDGPEAYLAPRRRALERLAAERGSAR